MFNSVVLDVVIGLVFIYLLYSLLVTIIQEMIATAFNFRAKILQRAIVRMLEDEDPFKPRFSSLSKLFRKNGNLSAKNSVSYDFYNHPLIKFMGENKRYGAPSYFGKETFSKVLIDLLRGDKIKPGDDVQPLIQQSLDDHRIKWGTSEINEQTLSFLRSVWADANGDVTKLKIFLENWFDETMKRVTGWYKRHTRFILFFVGLAVVILFNVNTIEIVNKLEKDPVVREQVIRQSEAFAKAHPDLDKEILILKAKSAKDSNGHFTADSSALSHSPDFSDLKQFELLKKREQILSDRADSLLNAGISSANGLLGLGWQTTQFKINDLHAILLSLLGWIISALAISLGAPFWFDLLNKLMKLRNAGDGSASGKKQKQIGIV
jgi:hypothetical protein